MSNFPHYIFLLDEEGVVNLPSKEGDAGYDVCAVSEPNIVGSKCSEGFWTRIDYIEYDLGLKVDGFQPVNSPNEDIYTFVFPRSSISKYNLLLANSVGIVDSGYRGSIKVRFKYILQPEDLFILSNGSLRAEVDLDLIYKKGDKVCQLVFKKHFHPVIEFVSSLEESDRNEGGFGSSGL